MWLAGLPAPARCRPFSMREFEEASGARAYFISPKWPAALPPGVVAAVEMNTFKQVKNLPLLFVCSCHLYVAYNMVGLHCVQTLQSHGTFFRSQFVYPTLRDLLAAFQKGVKITPFVL